MPFFGITTEQGAQTSLYLASSPDVATISGEYFATRKVAQHTPEADDLEVARRLWEVSEQLTGIARGPAGLTPRLPRQPPSPPASPSSAPASFVCGTSTMTNSTRRLAARPSRVLLSVSGRSSP